AENIYVTITFFVLASLGLLFSLCCLFLNSIYRKKEYIKMSSPHFNNVTVVGCMLCYVEVIWSTYIDPSSAEQNPCLCYITAFLLSTGFTLAFGGMFVKTWRIYKIFTNTQLRRRVGNLSNRSLLLRIVAVWFIDVIILSCWAVVDPMTIKKESIFEVNSVDDDVRVEILSYRSTSNYHLTWLASLFSLKGIMLIFGVFLAWETRNVHHPALNDSKSIALAVYNVFMFSFLGFVVTFAVEYPSLRSLINRSVVFAGTTSTICLLFVPKV
ncbi:unnamed protein product, partial [Porites lobata]